MGFYSKEYTVGVLGGGQLGRMLLQEAINLDVKLSILDPSANAPCAKIAHEFVVGDFNDYDTVVNFGRGKDVVTIEIEHVNVEALRTLQSEGVKVFPSPDILEIVKDKGLQKQFYADNNIPTSPFFLVENGQEVASKSTEFPVMQKLRTGGYDGRGVQALRSTDDLSKAFDAPSVLEKFVDFEKEISVIIARNESGEVKTFPVVELEFNPVANLVEFLFAPANISQVVEQTAQELAKKVVEAFDFVGILAVEMFVGKDGSVLVNEVAPRPHNSGHHTIEASVTSQYEQHVRAILDLPLGDTASIQAAVMVNLLGEPDHSGPVDYRGLEEVLSWPGVHPHIYGKAETKPFRKMGHVTICASTIEEAKELALRVKDTLKVVSE